jgi:alanyl-tRNA synthetase
MISKDIRRKFLDFFRGKGHEVVPSAPMVVKNDPTLMFTNAGMNQFKDYFLGNKEARFKRVADTQKCLRVSGKHHDLDEVGMDTSHHTMFEMLGNWSFGDYFNREAIDWAWELLTTVYRLDKDRLYVTYFGGDETEALEPDREAQSYWEDYLPSDRILPFGKKDNFWEMGDQGPCGPCSEIHYDLRDDKERAVSGVSLVNRDHPQVIEIWNLVFIQFNRLASGDLEPLPEKHVDTGMGFQRLVRVIKGKHSNYDTDLFEPLLEKIAALAGIQYGDDETTDVAMRVIADHLRALAFAIADGEMPSNTKGGYVIRRILRRAVRYGYTYLGFEEPVIHKLVPVLADQMSDVFPELKQQQDFVARVVMEEEETFLRTLANGIKRIEDKVDGKTTIHGEFIFELYDTYGFPKDLTVLILSQEGNDRYLDPDWEQQFQSAMEQQKNRSRAAQDKEEGDWIKVAEGRECEFVGYQHLEAESRILRYREVQAKNKTHYQLVLDKTPFYAESGGQVGDTGTLVTADKSIPVWDTKKENDLILHMVSELPDAIDQPLKAVVNAEKRKATENNHSATHLLHAALRQVLGDHVQQRGSLVNEKLLRFDFSHFTKMTGEELSQVEHLVNQKIRENIARNVREEVPLAKARDMGAMALFGEKYGDLVRVVSFDDQYSIELCGGTHVAATGQIGLFKIISEGSIASGVRRIEAITAQRAELLVDDRFRELDQIGELLKSPADTLRAVEALLDERNQMQKELEVMQRRELQQVKAKLLEQVSAEAGINRLIEQVQLPSAQSLKDLSFELKNKVSALFAVLAADIAGKPQIAVVISDDLVKELNLNAGTIVRQLARHISGGGGGQPFFATAGGKDLKGLPGVIEEAKQVISEAVAGNKQSS